MLENGNFGFIFCFNDVNMLKGIRSVAPIGLWPAGNYGIVEKWYKAFN